MFGLATYLVASVSFPQLIARAHGVDLHRVGTRNLGAGNLWREVGPLRGLTGGLLDALKPPLAMLLAQVFGASRDTQILCGAVAVVAQQWPLWHRFDGGRGNAPAIALGLAYSLVTSLAVAPVVLLVGAWALLRRMRGRRRGFTRFTPLAALLAIVLYPIAAALLREDPAIVLAAIAVGGLIVVRRLTARLHEDLRVSDDWPRILLNRLLFDRSELQRRALAADE